MIHDFVWILDDAKSRSFGKTGVSSLYIIPKEEFKISPSLLVGNRLWVVLRDTDDRIFISLRVKKIEKIAQGYHKNDFLCSIDLTNSFRLVSYYSEATMYIVDCLHSKLLGITDINNEISNIFIQKIFNNIETKFIKPHPKIFSEMKISLLPRNENLCAKEAIRIITSHFNLNEIWAEATRNKMSPFAHFAKLLVENHYGKNSSKDLISLLKVFDPLSSLKNINIEVLDKSIINNQSIRMVDIDFYEIEPNKIHAREFIASEYCLNDLEASLKKTDRAEKMHQEMLKDISEYLISIGIKPYCSSSIDLMYHSKDCLNIYEIKSSNNANLLAQASKGAFQLACYKNALIHNYENIKTQLILTKTENSNLDSYVKTILLSLNISVLFYNPNEVWPKKLLGIVE